MKLKLLCWESACPREGETRRDPHSRATEYSAHTKIYPTKTFPPPTTTPLEHGCTTTTRAPINCEGNHYYLVQLEVLIDQTCQRKYEGIKQMKFLCVRYILSPASRTNTKSFFGQKNSPPRSSKQGNRLKEEEEEGEEKEKPWKESGGAQYLLVCLFLLLNLKSSVRCYWTRPFFGWVLTLKCPKVWHIIIFFIYWVFVYCAW